MALFDGVQEDAEEHDRNGDADGIRDGGVVHDLAGGVRVVQEAAEALVAEQEVRRGDGAHERRGDGGDPVVLLLIEEVHGGGPQNDHGQRLVRPAEVTPDDGVVDLAEGIADAEDGANAQHGDAELQAVRPLLLVNLEPVGQRQTGAAECRIAGGDGAGDDAQHSQRHTDLTHRLDTDIVDSGGLAVGEDRGKAGVQAARDLIQCATGSGPHQGDNALGNHGAVEHEVTLLLALHAAGHQGALRRVEAGDSAAGDGDEHKAPDRGAARMHGTEVIPDLGDGVLRLDKDTNGHANGHDDQADTEQGVNLADDLVDGDKGGDEIIRQHNNQPEQRCRDDTGRTGVLEQRYDQARRADSKHGADHDQQHHAEHTHHVLHEAAEVDAGDLGDGSAVVALAHHAGEIIVHTAGENRTEGNPQEHDRSPQSTLHCAEDRAESGDVQKLNHKQLPLRQDDIVHAVVDLDGGRFTVIRAEGVFHDLAVNEIAADQQCQTNQKANHFCTLLLHIFRTFVSRKRPYLLLSTTIIANLLKKSIARFDKKIQDFFA